MADNTPMKNNDGKKDVSDIEKNFDVENSTIFTSNDSVNDPTGKKAKKDKTEGGVSNKSKGFVKMIAGLLAVAVVMAGVMITLKFAWPVADSDDEETETQSSVIDLTASANVALKDMKNADKNAISNVSKVTLDSSKGKIEIVPDKIVKTKDDNGNEIESVDYKVVGYKNIPLDSSVADNVVSNILDVKASQKLGGEWTDAQCGLDKPQVSVKVNMADGSSFDYSVGKQVPDGNNNFYAKTSLKDGIYLVSSEYLDDFYKAITDFVDMTIFEALTASGDNDTYFENSSLVKFDKINIDGSHVKNPITLGYNESSNESLIYRVSSPVSTYADDEKISNILSPLSSGMTASSAVMINPTAADLKKYGLDKPYFEIKYVVKGKTYTLKFSELGADTEGYYCCMVDNVPVIYNILESSYEFIEWDLTDIRSNLLYVRNIETIKTMTVEFEGKSTEYNVSYDKVQTTTSATTANDDSTSTTAAQSDEYKINVYSNSAVVEAKSFQLCYQHMILLRPVDYLKPGEKAPSGSSKLTITIKSTNGSTEQIKLTKYNDRYYCYTINGVGDALIRYDTIDSLINDYKTLQKGESVKE